MNVLFHYELLYMHEKSKRMLTTFTPFLLAEL